MNILLSVLRRVIIIFFTFHVRALFLTFDSEFLSCHLKEDVNGSGKGKVVQIREQL